MEDNLLAKDIISSDISASQERVYILYNSPLESATNEICVINSAKPSKTLTTYFVFFFIFPGTALETRLFIASLLVLAKRFSIKMLNVQNVCFVNFTNDGQNQKTDINLNGVYCLIPKLHFCITCYIIANESAKKKSLGEL